jgi:putative flippase GtrA
MTASDAKVFHHESGDCCGSSRGGGCTPSLCVDNNPCTTDFCNGTQCAHTTIADPCCDGSLGDALGNMDEGLSAYFEAEDLPANLEIEEPVVTESGVSVALFVYDSGGQARAGTASAGCGDGGGTTALTVNVTNDNGGGGFNQRWTLTVDAWVDGDTIYFFVDLEHESIPSNAAGGGVASVTVYHGGWTYSDATGPLEAAGSDAGFHDQAAAMFNLAAASNAATAQAISLSTVLQFLSNVAQLLANYTLDRFVAWSAPTTCFAPQIRSSCNNVNVSCSSGQTLKELCKKIGNIPDVSQAFKKCMKGRCACGGSYHPRLRVECDTDGTCNVCGSGAGGCNNGGTSMWYCQPESASNCICVDTIFHEMSHACGAVHNQQYWQDGFCSSTNTTDVACRIGKWFEQQFIAEHGTCNPVNQE